MPSGRRTVVVSIHHRLNALGFANLAEFGGSDFASSGNVGMLDIVHALRWVRQNIEEFGGDPNNVTAFGQSGGGRKVGIMLTMPAAKGLFHRAVMQSPGAPLRAVDRARAVRNAEQLLAKLGLGKQDARKAQQLPFANIVAAYSAVLADNPTGDESREGFAPFMDGEIIPQHPFDPGASPLMADVPLMIGSNRTEMTGFSLRTPADFALDQAGRRARVATLLGDQTDAVVEVYRKVNSKATPSDLFFLIASDYRYNGPAMKIAERRAALAKGPCTRSCFTWETPVDNGKLGSPHSMEVPFVFNNVQISFSANRSRCRRGGARRQNQRGVDCIRTHRQSGYQRIAEMARLRSKGPVHHGVEQ